jgi:L-iditol 2-dehydrogenase
MIQIKLVKPRKLIYERVERPKPGKGQVLVKVQRCGVCGSDLTIYRGRHPYAKSPLVMGHEFSGTISEVAPDVRDYRPGTRVAVIPHLACGDCQACSRGIYNFCEQLKCLGAEADGAHSNFINVPAKMICPIPDNMSLDDAAMLEPASVAHHAARRGAIEAGDRVLVIGAGPIGIFTMQCCKAMGASEVYLADVDDWRLDIGLKLGADGILDTSESTLKVAASQVRRGPEHFDVFFDCVGEQGDVLDQILTFAKRGSRIVVVGVLQTEYSIPHLPHFVQHELTLSGTTMYTPKDYTEVIKLICEGSIRTAGMITHYFDLADVDQVFDMMENKRQRYLKIMLRVNELTRTA